MKSNQQFLKFIMLGLTIFISACANNAAIESERVQQQEVKLMHLEQLRVLDEAEREEARRQVDAARFEADRQRELEAIAARSFAEEARIAARREAEELRQVAAFARQQDRVKELSLRIQSINDQTEAIESANNVLSEALETAEAMSSALSEENQKFNTLDPATGFLQENIDIERLSELAARLKQFRAEAAALQVL